jgi:hypothetical protein
LQSYELYGLGSAELRESCLELGTPVGWHPLITGYDALPEPPTGLPPIPQELLDHLATHQCISPSPEELTHIKERLRTLYEAGSGAKEEEIEERENGGRGEWEEENNEEENTAIGGRIPIPTETFLEELSQKLEIHPISVYWLLKEMREKEGLVCKPELKRHTEDFFSVHILRLLGHRWPKQIEQDEPVPEWADQACPEQSRRDGIVPITGDIGEPTLLERMREKIEAIFGHENAHNVEIEAGEILGKPLGDWLERDFFKRHVSQFKRRPIAWQLASRSGLFSCLVYYHKLTAEKRWSGRAMKHRGDQR